jgi:hypothetical protein
LWGSPGLVDRELSKGCGKQHFFDEHVEQVSHNDKPLVYIVRADLNPEQTTFLTPPEFKQQVGFVVYPAGAEIARHVHLPLERHIVGTSEVIIVKQGRCLLDVYNDDHELIATRELGPGELMLRVGGGHGFRMLEDTVLLEIKQGLYTGPEEKALDWMPRRLLKDWPSVV